MTDGTLLPIGSVTLYKGPAYTLVATELYRRQRDGKDKR